MELYLTLKPEIVTKLFHNLTFFGDGDELLPIFIANHVTVKLFICKKFLQHLLFQSNVDIFETNSK